MATPVILHDKYGYPLLTAPSPWGRVLLSAEPIRIYGQFQAATNSGVQIQTVVPCTSGQALYITDMVLSANKTPGSTVTVRFYDAATNAENIVVADSAESTVNLAIHPAGRTIGWDCAYIQLVTDTIGQAATLTVWYVRITGDLVLSYAKWNALRGL